MNNIENVAVFGVRESNATVYFTRNDGNVSDRKRKALLSKGNKSTKSILDSSSDEDDEIVGTVRRKSLVLSLQEQIDSSDDENNVLCKKYSRPVKKLHAEGTSNTCLKLFTETEGSKRLSEVREITSDCCERSIDYRNSPIHSSKYSHCVTVVGEGTNRLPVDEKVKLWQYFLVCKDTDLQT